MSDDVQERRESDVEKGRNPAQRSFHAAVHHVGFSHDCDGSWLDDNGWDRIPDALIAAGWTASAPAESIVGDVTVERPTKPTLDVIARWHNELATMPDARERVMADIAHILGRAQAGDTR